MNGDIKMDYYKLQPQLPNHFGEVINKFYKKLNRTNNIEKLVEFSLDLLMDESVKKAQEHDKLTLKLIINVILDTSRQGWSYKYKNGELLAFPPSNNNDKIRDQREIKRVIQNSLQEARNDQINEETKKAFILRMEKKRLYKGKEVSILNHFLDPQEYYLDLSRRIKAPESIKNELLERSINPYLQLVDDSRDAFTNIKLNDIWRYARYSWSLPLGNQPGRQMLYLIRDGSREFHPIIGIGALGSSIAQISCRDNYIGWSIDTLSDGSNIDERIIALEKSINSGIDDLFTDDFLMQHGYGMNSNLNYTFNTGILKIDSIKSSLEKFMHQELLSFSNHIEIFTEDDILNEFINSFDISKYEDESEYIVNLLEQIIDSEMIELDILSGLKECLYKSIDDYYRTNTILDTELVVPKLETLEKVKSLIQLFKNIKTVGELNTENILEDTLKPEYKKRRLEDLEQLLHARFYFNIAKENNPHPLAIYNYLKRDENGKRALRNAIKNVKKEHMGSSIMDITTCGAIPPYNEVLGGKLVSLLMSSPKVIEDYRKKYSDATSIIASRKKGEKVVRTPNLATLATTSLYYTGSSQYNRIKYKTNNGELKFSYVGNTKGFGSVHLSSKTYKIIQELLEKHPNLEREDSTFSAGVNFKMRSIAKGLGFIGMSKLQQHENPRLVYLIPLLKNWKNYLNGVDKEAEYIFNMTQIDNEMDNLVCFWKERWYVKRIQKIEILEKIKQQNALKISNFIKNDKYQNKLRESGSYQYELLEDDFMDNSSKISWKVVSQLNNSRTSFAERLTKEEIETLHISTKLDSELLRLVNEGNVILLVGNPGDGKTHLIKKWENKFPSNVIVNYDASAVNDEELVQQINQAIQNKLPAVFAINEGPLRKILEKLEAKDEIKNQLNSPFNLKLEAENKCILINLGLRQILSKSILNDSLMKLLNEVDYTDAPEVIKYNVQQLKRDKIKNRLFSLLDLLRKSGTHVTMNELLGFYSYVITNGKLSFKQKDKIIPYFDAVFDERNPLYIYLKQFDPYCIPHPIIDMEIYDKSLGKNLNELIKKEYIENPEFYSMKRYFYFNNEAGEKVLDMLPDEYKNFYEMLEGQIPASRAKKRVMEAIGCFFDNGHKFGQFNIWSSLKYEAKKESSIFISTQSVPEKQISIEIPQLNYIQEGIIEYEPSFIKFKVVPNEEKAETVILDIDLELWLALIKSKKGISNFYQDPVITRRLTTFMSKLSRQMVAGNDETTEVLVLNSETGQIISVSVLEMDNDGGKYDW